MHVGLRVHGTSIHSIYVHPYTYRARESQHAPVDIHFPFTLHAECPTKIQQCKRFLVGPMSCTIKSTIGMFGVMVETLYSSAGYIAYICSLDCMGEY